MKNLLIKLFAFYKKNAKMDLVRKIIYFIFSKLKWNVFGKVRGLYHFKSGNVNIGKRVDISGQAYNIRMGLDVNIYPDCKFEFGEQAIFSVGNNSLFSYGVVVSCRNQINIGNDVQVGEYTSIRDSTHNYEENGEPIRLNNDITAPILIGNNVWIGRACLILKGSIIEDGVVVGANSIVKGVLEKNGIYAGSPAKFIKKRVG